MSHLDDERSRRAVGQLVWALEAQKSLPHDEATATTADSRAGAPPSDKEGEIALIAPCGCQPDWRPE